MVSIITNPCDKPAYYSDMFAGVYHTKRKVIGSMGTNV